MSNFEIRKGIPVPPKIFTRKYNFEDLEIGDSILVPYGENDDPLKLANNVSSAAKAYAKQTGKKFSVRKTKQGIGCWRIDPNARNLY